MKKLLFLFCILGLTACQPVQEKVDLIVTNANIYTVDEAFSQAEALAIRDGKVVALGSSIDMLADFESKDIIDAQGQYIYPGFIDAHCHFYGLGQQLQRVDLVGTQSYQEVLDRVQQFNEERQPDFIIGRGWDQNDWSVKEFPTNARLNEMFPDTPVALTRIDGHAMIANQAALDLAGINVDTKIEGGDIVRKDGKLTGILVDNPMELVEAVFPSAGRQEDITALLDAQQINLSYGLTTVDDAGLHQATIELIDSLQQAGDLRIKIYAMVSNTPENLDYFLSKGIIKTDRLHVRSVKFYADGALGSRGAAMKEPYSDQHNHFGALLSSVEEFENTAQRIAQTDYQMNTHAIGDSANYVVLKTYKKLLSGSTDRRWRVEHAQIVDPADFHFFDHDNVLPSVQPTHATSDMYWAEDRVGSQRIKGAYAYKKLLDESGRLALGTDYPVEQVSPFLTFYAAVGRKDTSGFPEEGFLPEQALTRKEALQGMTIWAAYANFEEQEKGSLEPGKAADFILMKKDIMQVDLDEIPKLTVEQTYINGQKVYDASK
ncbi:amidohydrolase [Nonlabens xiamenensis]|uniref:amidohydrolase n=1 Tax=Nonlabens xiamenensis TaxID=2341043 RepID=UPI000F605646|nr:amidohydrolase [Nonlabens xiamenensis]